jgi:hypothetical protein
VADVHTVTANCPSVGGGGGHSTANNAKDDDRAVLHAAQVRQRVPQVPLVLLQVYRQGWQAHLRVEA